MKSFNLNFEEEILFLKNYNLTPNEYLVVRILLLATNETFSFSPDLISVLTKLDVSEVLQSLQDKQIILKSCKIPKKGDVFKPENIELNKNFIKSVYKCSFELGQELWEHYPTSIFINNSIYNIRTVSKKFNSEEEFFRFYAKTIGYNESLHNEILELVDWARENNIINCSICNFVIDKGWDFLKSIKEGDAGNINYDSVKML